jgi:hypothetical protein
MRKDSMTRLGLPLVAALCGFPLFAQLGAAATLIVTTTADNGAGSLRAAITAASDGDTIQFDATLNGQTISLTGGQLLIDKNITINGPGPNLLAVSRVSTASRFRIFAIMSDRTVILGGLTISAGHTDAAGSGGIGNAGTLTISNCIVSGNFGDGGTGGGGIGNSGTLTIVDSVISNNRAGFTTGNPFGSGGGINSSGTLTIINSTISNNRADLNGGGIVGGGIVTITDSTISGNRGGSGTLQLTGFGGGLNVGGTVEIRNSTISGNIAMGNGSGAGGGIYSTGEGGTLTVANSTISGNEAGNAGGGISNSGTGGISVVIINSTISDNRASMGGGIGGNGSAALEIGNTILRAGTLGANILYTAGTITSRGYNLSSDNGGGFLTGPGDQINTNPMLGPLQDNGGPTFTHEPLTGSPALNAGDPNFTPPPLFDQRGYPRVFNGRIDIGSLEAQSAPPTPSPTTTATPTPTATATPTATPSATASPTGTPAPTPTATPSASPTPSPSPARALNISTRLRVELGDRVMIGGFIVAGNPLATSSGPSGSLKNVAVRGIGPSLIAFGINDALADPTLELRAANGALLFQNDNWQDNPAHAAQLTALDLAPQHPNESGIVATLLPGAYTAIVAGKNQTTGIGLVEVYDADSAAASQLANISTRGFVQTGDNVMIGGFILGGSSNNTGIVVRGIGPSLAQFGLSNVLADPTLELRDSNGALLISNDDWQNDPAQAAQLSARGLAPQDAKESGIFASLPSGAFTAILGGKNAGIGIGLIEIYNVQ